jgi:hypothetical protein
MAKMTENGPFRTIRSHSADVHITRKRSFIALKAQPVWRPPPLIEACSATHRIVAPSQPVPCFALIARPNEQAIEAVLLFMKGRTCSTYGAYSAPQPNTS